MASVIDNVSIKGMKHTDFEQLNQILLDSIEEGCYYGRKDWYEQRNKRLLIWLNECILEVLQDSKIQG